MCVPVVTSLLAQFCSAWGGGHYGSHWPRIDLLFYWDTHTHKLSLNHTHTHSLLDFNFTLQQSLGADG